MSFPNGQFESGAVLEEMMAANTSEKQMLSDPHALQRENELLRAQLREAQKLTALGELLGTTTHEFNNVLMSVINYAKMGIRHRDDETRDRALSKILSAGERAAKISNSILGMARNRSTKIEATPLPQLVDDTLVLLERELRKYRISLTTHYDEQVPEALINGNQIQQILLNLVTNARQAMQQGGMLTITVSHDRDHHTVDLMIRDTGSGIPSDQLPRIFDRFYTTKSGPDESGKGGTGLGLSACRDIIEAHRGRVRVESTPGKGTAFTIKLPAANSQATPATGSITNIVASATPTSGPTSRVD